MWLDHYSDKYCAYVQILCTLQLIKMVKLWEDGPHNEEIVSVSPNIAFSKLLPYSPLLLLLVWYVVLLYLLNVKINLCATKKLFLIIPQYHLFTCIGKEINSNMQMRQKRYMTNKTNEKRNGPSYFPFRTKSSITKH